MLMKNLMHHNKNVFTCNNEHFHLSMKKLKSYSRQMLSGEVNSMKHLSNKW